MKERPQDFSIRYWWREGSVPPPYHYEYSIHLGPGSAGEIVFYPNYPMEKPPVWQESFDINIEALDELHGLIEEKQLFARQWTEIEDPPVGSSLEWMEVIAGESHIVVPGAINEAQVVNDIYAMIKSLMPPQIWSKLKHQYEKYQRDYLEKEGDS